MTVERRAQPWADDRVLVTDERPRVDPPLPPEDFGRLVEHWAQVAARQERADQLWAELGLA